MDQRTIRVKGRGRVSVAPDRTQLRLTLRALRPEYEDAIGAAGQQLEEIRSALEPEGFLRADIRTESFDVRAEYERREDLHRKTRTVFAGWAVHNSLRLEFDLDTKRLGRVLKALATCPVDPEISVGFAVKDESAVKDELLRRAVDDAKGKAAILASSAGVSLGDIVSIDYSWGEVEFRTSHYALQASPVADAMVDIEPEELAAADTVTVIWAIV